MEIKELQKLVAHLEGQREKRLNIWRELHQYIIPHAGLFSGEVTERVAVQRNPSAQGSLRRGAAGMTSAMTPNNLPWFRLGFAYRELDELTHARDWLDTVEEKVSSAISSGGFYQAIHAANQELIGYGCMLLYCELDTRVDVDGSVRTRPRYACVTAGTYCCALGVFGDLEVVVRFLRYTAQQCKDKFGEAVLSDSVKRLLASAPHTPIDVLHVVMPNPQGKRGTVNSASMPFHSFYYERGGQEYLGRGGYTDMPYMFATWAAGREVVYGTGPGDEALPDVKMIQAMETKKLLGLDKTIDPPVTRPMGFRGEISTLPGAQNEVNNFENTGIRPLYEINFLGGLQAISASILDVQRRIDDTLLASVFADPYFDSLSNVTATAIRHQRQQKALLMGPALSAYENTVLSRVIIRTITLLDNSGELPPVPPPLDAQLVLPRDIVSIDYISPLSQSLRASNAEATQRLVADVFGMAQANPEVLDKLNLDEVVDVLARGSGAPGSIVRSDEQVQQVREERAKAQQQAQAQAQMQQLAGQVLNGGQGLENILQQ